MAHWEQFDYGAPLFNADKTINQFEDELAWDKFQKTLVLTSDAVRNELAIDLEDVRGDNENVIAFLRELSQLLYTYILKKKPAVLEEKTRYFLHYDLRNRRIIYLCLIDLIRYSIYGGGNVLGYQPSVNLNESGLIDIEKVRDERIMSFVTDGILKTNRLVDRNFVDYFELPPREENDGTW